MINKFRIVSTHGVKSVLGTGWFYKGSIQLKSIGVLAPSTLFTDGMLYFRITV